MDKFVIRIKTLRYNWWEAFKDFIKLPGYGYYKPPKEIKYRYPAPGSVPQDVKSYPSLFKPDWKTPFKDSHHNIRPIERGIKPGEEFESFIVGAQHKLDPKIEQHRNVLAGPTIDLRLNKPPHVPTEKIFNKYAPRQEGAKRIRDALKQAPIDQAYFVEFECPALGFGVSEIYNPTYMIHHPRGANPLHNDRRLQHMYLELEWYITDVINKERIETKKMDMYKGTVKKWQVLDDQAYSRDQIEKIQSAIKAPNPEELEAYREDNKRPMTLPITNQNVSEWRDQKRAIDSADFNSKLIEFQKNRSQNYFMKRYERPKELSH